MGQRFRGQVVIVTGASSGIGRATSLAFAREGARVVLGARRKDELEEAAALARRGGREARAVACNVTVPAQVKRLVEAAVERWGRLDVVVANAGVGLIGDLLETSRDDLRHVFEVNVMGVVNTIHAAVPAMVASGGGTVVIVSSVLGYRGIPRYAGYCASKFALNGLAEALRDELAPVGVRVTLVCPGLTDTEFYARRLGTSGPEPVRDKFRPMSAEAVASGLVDAVHRRRKRVVMTAGGKVLAQVSRHAPWLADFMISKWHRSMVRAAASPPGAAPAERAASSE